MTPLNVSLVMLSVIGLTACKTATSVSINTDPTGADVECVGLGYLGATSLQKKFTEEDASKLGGSYGWLFGAFGKTPFTANFKISKRGYLTVNRAVSFSIGDHIPLKVTLAELLSKIQVTSEPEGVGVFHLKMAPVPSPGTPAWTAADAGFKGNPVVAASNAAHKRHIIRRFLGQTPYDYRPNPDPAKGLQEGDVLLFQKAGYNDQVLYYQPQQERQHVIMVPTAIKAR